MSLTIEDFDRIQHFTLVPYEADSYGNYLFDGGIVVNGNQAMLGEVVLEYRIITNANEDESENDWQGYELGQTITHQSKTLFGVQFRNHSYEFSNNPNQGDNYYHIRSTLQYLAIGKITSLLIDPYLDDPEIPAGAFYKLFNETLVVDASHLVLPDYVSDFCYTGLFRGCGQLKNPPKLPAQELAASCYFYMFQNCTSLTKAPRLQGTSGYNNSYDQMFVGCSNLNEVIMDYPSWPLPWPQGIPQFLSGVSTIGNFLYSNISFDPTSVLRDETNGVPPGWSIAFYDPTPYLRLTSLEDNNTIALTQIGSTTITLNLQCRTNLDLEWQDYQFGTEITLMSDSWIEFRNDTGRFSIAASVYNQFTSTKKFNVSGRIGSLLSYTQEIVSTTSGYLFMYLFADTNIVDASQLYINLSTLGNYACRGMFSNCSSLTQAPDLRSITTINTSGCSDMFVNCTSLTKAPDLLATTLGNGCYSGMFNGCSNLTQAPLMIASKLAGSCYTDMFRRTNVSHIVWRSKTIPKQSYCQQWLWGAPSSGTFEYTYPLLDIASIPRNEHGVPEGWTISQIKPQQGMSLSINGINVSSIKLSSSPISTLYINGNKVKSQAAIGTDIELPSIYTKLLYVDSNGGYLDTGIPTTGDLKVGIKWSKTRSGNSSWPELFGNFNLTGTAGQYYQSFAFRCNTSSRHYDYYHGLYSDSYPTYGGRVDIEESSTDLGDQIHEYWMDPINFSFDGQVFNTVDYTNEHDKDGYRDWEFQPERISKNNMYLFNARTSGRNAIINCYNFYIIDTKTNTVLLNYIPCKLGSLVGFYDSVLQTFVTHASFLAGPQA